MLEKDKFKEWKDATNFLIELKKEAGLNNYKGALIGTGIGAGLGGLSSGLSETSKNDNRSTLKRVAHGALGGGITGGIFGSIYDVPNLMKNRQNATNFITNNTEKLYQNTKGVKGIQKDMLASAEKKQLQQIEDKLMNRAHSVRKMIKAATFADVGKKVLDAGKGAFNATKDHVVHAGKMMGAGAAGGAGLGIIRATGDNSHPGETIGQTATRYAGEAGRHALGGGAIGLGFKGLSVAGKLPGITKAALNLAPVGNFIKNNGSKLMASKPIQSIGQALENNPNLVGTLGMGAVGAGIGGLSDGTLEGAATGGVMGAGLGAAGTYGRKGIGNMLSKGKSVVPEIAQGTNQVEQLVNKVPTKGLNIHEQALHNATTGNIPQQNPLQGYDMNRANMVGFDDLKHTSNYSAGQPKVMPLTTQAEGTFNTARSVPIGQSLSTGNVPSHNMYQLGGSNGPSTVTPLKATANKPSFTQLPPRQISPMLQQLQGIKMAAMAMPAMNNIMKTPMVNTSLNAMKPTGANLVSKIKTPGTSTLKNQLPANANINPSMPQPNC